MTTTDTPTLLSEQEYQAALVELADYERHIAESDRLAQADSMRIAGTLGRLYRDHRWVDERNEQRRATAKTSRGGAPVDPQSRSQFSTWVRDRFHRYQPRRVYQLLDAQSIAANYLHSVQVTPVTEAQVRPLRPLTSVANGSGSRIPEVWTLACKMAAEDGRDQPTESDVRAGIAEWRHLHLPPVQARKERAEDHGWVLERRAEAAWDQLVRRGKKEQIEKFLNRVSQDIDHMKQTGERPS
jgi:hypothetical protein